MFFTHPLLFPFSIFVREGDNGKKHFHIAPLFFKREGKGVSCVRDAEGAVSEASRSTALWPL